MPAPFRVLGTAIALYGLGLGQAWVKGAAGELDTSFGTAGFVRTEVRSDDHGYGMALQPDGKIVVAGSALSADFATSDFALVRYLSTGALDTGFGSGGKVTTGFTTGNDIAYDVAIQSDGKIVVVGETNDATASNANFALARYTAAGALDTSFGTGGKVTTGIGTLDDYAMCLAIQSDGKILVAGYTYNAADTTNIAIARYTTAGALDTTFGSGGKVTTDLGGIDVAQAITVQADGKIVIAGATTTAAGDKADSALLRYNANGSLDTTFNSNGKLIASLGAVYDYAKAVVVQPDGKIVIAATLIESGIAVARYNANGTADSSFGTSGKVQFNLSGTGLYDAVNAMVLQADGKLLITGSTIAGDQDDAALARLTSAGALDSGFGSSGIVISNFSPDASADYGYALALQSDGSILLAGDSSTADAGYDVLVARYQATGVAAPQPTAVTNPASSITGTTATLNGTVNAQSVATTISFEYGLTTSYGSTAAATPGTLSDNADTSVSAALTGLTEGATYHFRVKAVSGASTIYGADRSFTTTAAPPPVITAHPHGVMAEAGSAFILSVQATGTGLTYLWQRDGSPLSTETAPTLAITNLQSAQAGLYTCVVSNASGASSTSDPAIVSLVTSLSTALDSTAVVWQTPLPGGWSVVTSGTHDGVDGLQGTVGNASTGTCSLRGNITGPVNLFWFYKLSATSGKGFLRVLLDGSVAFEDTGTKDWTAASLAIPAGTHALEFRYAQDSAAPGGIGSESAWIDQLSTGAATTISTPPQSQIAIAGETVTLALGLSGQPTTCQWRKNGQPLSGETNAQLAIANIAAAHAALYTCQIGTGDISSPASLTVVTPASLLAKAPLGKTVTFTQTLANGLGATFQWQRNGVNLVEGSKYAGTKTAKLTVKALTLLDAGADYTCRITLGSLVKDAGPYEVAILPPPTIDQPPPMLGMVSGLVDYQPIATNSATSWSVSGLPAGLVFDSKTGRITGKPTAADKYGKPYTVVLTATNAAGPSTKVSFTLSVASLPQGTLGNFRGLLARNAALNASLGGSLSLAVSSNGYYTGTLVNGTSKYTLKNWITTDVFTEESSINLSLSRTGKTPLLLSLTIQPATGSLSGTLTGDGETVNVQAARTPSTAAFAGRFNTLLSVPAAQQTDLTVPQGHSYTQWLVSSTGSVTISGKLADGTVLTGSSLIATDGSFPFYQVAYANHGSALGHYLIASDGSVSSTDMSWKKTAPASTTDTKYPAGFDIACEISGARWIAPTKTSPMLLGLPDLPDNAALQFTSGGIEAITQAGFLDQTFRITRTPSAVFRTITTGNPCNVKLSFTASTGLFTGSATLTDPGLTKPITRTVSYYGVLLPDRQSGAGFFLLPPLSPATLTQSGRVQLLPTVAP